MVQKELNEGGRVFITCPLVEESDKDITAGVKAPKQEHEQLQQSQVLDHLHHESPGSKVTYST